MALKFEKGVLTSPGSTGVQTTSLVDTGFGTVKALILWATYETAEADVDGNGIFSMGYGTDRGGTPSQWYNTYLDIDGGTTSSCAQGQGSGSILKGLSAVTPTVDYNVALDNLGDAAFGLDWTDLPGTSSIKVHYIALGGDDITDALVGSFDVPTSTGNLDETVVSGFGKPDLIFTLGCKGNNTESDEAASANLNFGIGKDDASEGHTSWGNNNNQADMQCGVHQTATLLGQVRNYATGTAYVVGELTAKSGWPTDGFRVNITTAPPGTTRIGYLALRGTFTAVIGSNTAPTAAPTVKQDLEVGATPRGAIFFHNALPVTAGVDVTHASLGCFGIGGTDGTREGWSGVGNDDGNGTSEAHRHHSESKAVKMFSPGTSGTLQSEADSSFVGTAVRLAWGNTDSIAREYRYLLLGDAVPPLRHPAINFQDPALV